MILAFAYGGDLFPHGNVILYRYFFFLYRVSLIPGPKNAFKSSRYFLSRSKAEDYWRTWTEKWHCTNVGHPS